MRLYRFQLSCLLVCLFVCPFVYVCPVRKQNSGSYQPIFQNFFFPMKEYADFSILPNKEHSTGNSLAEKVEKSDFWLGFLRCMLCGYLSAQRQHLFSLTFIFSLFLNVFFFTLVFSLWFFFLSFNLSLSLSLSLSVSLSLSLSLSL